MARWDSSPEGLLGASLSPSNLWVMDTYKCIATKRDLRSFTDALIPEEALEQILNAGRLSGSSRNRQPWRFLIIRDRSRLRHLATFGRFAQHVATASAAIVLIVDETHQAFDAGRCAQNMMLAAWNAGIASCPATLDRSKDAAVELGIPESKTIAVVISLGYPDPRGRRPIERTALRILAGRGRRPLATLVTWEQYRDG